MVNNRALVILALLAILAWVANTSLFIVDETQRGLKLQFGEIVQDDLKPGLHAKWPLIQSVVLFDGRVLTFESTQSRFLTAGRNEVIVDAFVKWRVINPTRFYEATRANLQRAQSLIEPRVEESLRNAFGRLELADIISEQRDGMLLAPRETLDKLLRDELGVAILDMRIKRIELPEGVAQAVYERMRTERYREARESRALGQEENEKIRADADRKRAVILAHARQDSEVLRGEGDAQASAIYADAYGKNESFFRFYRSLQAYRDSFASGDDTLVLSPDSGFLRYFKGSQPTP